VLDKFVGGGCTKNIPLRYLPLFEESGHSVFSPTFDQPSLLDHPDLVKFLHWHFPNSDELDDRIFGAARDHIASCERPGHMLVTLVKLDHCSHWEGVDSPAYDHMLLRNDEHIRELTESYLAKESDGAVFVVSDHGMANITKAASFDLEAHFGRPSATRYAYFSEGTLLRVWIPDTSLHEGIANYLDGIAGLERLTETEREEQGLTRREFGDLIYHTPEGTQIVPSFWGPKPSKGMHGHHPRFPGQHGVCLSNRCEDLSEALSAVDFHRVLAGHMGA
jgi:predicted AlkP superfamily pyrophosphatase or phosphodiesterase